jgi:hypothetical protein
MCLQAVHVATASPTSGPSLLGSASSSISISVTGCPGAVAALAVTDLQMQLLQPVTWTVTSQAAVDPSLGALQLDANSSREVAYSIRYLAQPQPQVKQLVGTVVVSNLGQQHLRLQQVVVEVMPLSPTNLGQPPFMLPVKCPLSSSSSSRVASAGTAAVLQAATDVAPGSSLHCSFAGPVPQGLGGHVAISARVLQPDGTTTSSPAVTYDLSQRPQQVVTSGACAVVSDGFLGGRGRIVPQHSSRPAAAAAATRVCNTQTVSFVARLGPFGSAACGKKLWVSGTEGAVFGRQLHWTVF